MENIKSQSRTLLAAAISMAVLSPTQAIEFYSAGIEGTFDSQISIGSSWRVEDRNENLTTVNTDDGGLNYSKGDAISQILKGSHDLQLTYENYGAFVRGKYWYDYAQSENGVNHGQSSDGLVASNGPLDDSEFDGLSKFSGAEILDAFVYGEFDLLDMPLDVRLGKQVVSWGESTFIRGGINAINPVDVASFRRPGAEIKEGLIPVNMAYANLGVNDVLSVEAFYQLGSQETVIPGCGTYFTTNDYVPQGCNGVTTQAGVLPRGEDVKAKSDGQYGVAMRLVTEVLGGTEFGLYAMNIHSRLPIASATISAAGALQDGKSIGYRVVYPEDSQLFGLSFATNVGSVALSGEVSHKKDVALQIEDGQLITAALTSGPTGSGAPGSAHGAVLGSMGSSELDGMFQAAWDESITTGEAVDVDGFEKHDVTQVQVTAIKLFNQVGPIDRIVFVGEAGYTFVHEFDGEDDAIRLNTSIEDITEEAWGYRARVTSYFADVIAGVNLSPGISYNKDVKGYAPQPGGAFSEGVERIGINLKADYMSTYNAAISYTQYSGGEDNKLGDRDFAAITLGMSF